MADISSKLPEGFRIRRLQLNDSDRLLLYTMPNHPSHLLTSIHIKTAFILYKIGLGIALALILSIVLYVLTVIMTIAGLPINGWWIGISWLVLLGICIRVTLTLREDWLQFCWVVEQQERFVAYSVLRPYGSYSVLEWLQVHPKWARRGIGSTLVKTMIDQSPKPVYVDSAVRAVKFYIRLGFHKIRFKELPPDAQKHFSLRGVATLLVYEGIQND